MRLSTPHLLLDARAELGEGPAWDAASQRLYWLDIYAGRLHLFDPHSGQDTFFESGKPLGCAAQTKTDEFILGLQDGLATAQIDGAQLKLSYLARPENALPGNRFNDGKCDPAGRFLAGSMDNAEVEASGSLYSLHPNGTLKTLKTGVRISNGLTWSPDYKTFYYIDTPTRQILAYEYDLASGEIANPRVAITVPEGLGWPDGMTSDTCGQLWVALWGGAALTVWNPATGSLVEKIALPAKNVTSCIFGGPDLNEVYVTSARKGLDQATLTAYPATGGLFRLQTNLTGLPTFVYGG